MSLQQFLCHRIIFTANLAPAKNIDDAKGIYDTECMYVKRIATQGAKGVEVLRGPGKAGLNCV